MGVVEKLFERFAFFGKTARLEQKCQTDGLSEMILP